MKFMLALFFLYLKGDKMSDKHKKKHRFSNFIFFLIFLIGLLILLYPFFTAVYYDYQSSNEVKDFTRATKTLSEKQIDKRIRQAMAYNATLTNNEPLKDTFTSQEKSEGRQLYAKMLEVNEKIGHVEIPKIHQDLPLYAGTTNRVLQIGLGHLEHTSLPVGGPSTHAVISGHRGLPDKKMLRDLDEMEKGDMIFIHNIKGILAYKVDHKEVIKPTDFEKLKIENGKDKVTLLTCTPYMINSHRLIVTGHRVPYTPEIAKQHEKMQEPWWYRFMSVYWNYLIGLLIALILYLLYRLYRRYKEKRSIKNKR